MKFDRRSLIKGGAAGLAFASLGGLTKKSRAQQTKTPRKLIVIFAIGGWDPTYSVDPKPGIDTIDAPSGREEQYAGNIRIWAGDDRPNVSELFRRYGSIGAVVNGMQMMSFVHPDCWKRVLTGTASDSSPDLCAITAYELAPGKPVPYLVLGQTAYTGHLASIAARAGSTKQILGLLDARYAPPSDAELAGISRPSFSSATEDKIRKYVLARAERDRAVRGQGEANGRLFRDFLSSIDRGNKLKSYAGDFGGRSPTLDIGAQLELALKALSSGLSQAVMVEHAAYDTHAMNSAQAGMQNALCGAVTKLLDDLDANHLLDQTVVAVVSEMGRTPKLNAEAGKDHWPVTSALLFGAGVRGGSVLGGTNDRLEAENVDFDTGAVDTNGLQLLFSNFAAGVLDLAGVDSEAYLPGVEVFRALRA